MAFFEVVKKKAKQLLYPVAEKAKEAVIKTSDKLTDTFGEATPIEKVRARDVLREIPDAARQVFLETPFRAATSIGLEAIGKTQEAKKLGYDANKSVEVPDVLKPFLGKEDLKAFSQMPRTTKTADFLEKRGVPKEIAQTFGMTAGFALTAAEADPTIFGSGKKEAASQAYDIVQTARKLKASDMVSELEAIVRRTDVFGPGNKLYGEATDALEALKKFGGKTNPEIKRSAAEVIELANKTIESVEPRAVTAAGKAGFEKKVLGDMTTNPEAGFLDPSAFIPKSKEVDEVDNYFASKVGQETPSFYQNAKSVTKDFMGNLKSKLVDSFSPISDAIHKSGVQLKATEDPRLLRNRVLGSGGIADQMLKDGVEPTLKQIGVDRLDDFNRYLVARHALDVNQRGIKTGIDPQMAKQYMIKYGQDFEEAAASVTAYTQHMLKYAQKAGLISEELYSKLLDRYPNYVPLQRIFKELDDKPAKGITRAVASLGKQNVVKKLVGSDRGIISPLDAIVEKTYQITREAEVNRTAQALANLRHLDEFKDIIKPVAEKGRRPTISVFEDGKKVLYEVPKEFEEAAKNLGEQSMNILGRILSVPVRVARLGITGINPGFILSNFVRDQQTAFLASERGFKTSLLNPYNFAASLFDSIGKRGSYEDFLRAGGGSSDFITTARGAAAKTVKEMARSKGSKIATTIINPAQWLRKAEDLVAIGEQTTRTQQFRGTRKALGESGKVDVFAEPTEAALKAVQAGRENTVDFAKKGAYGNVLNSVFIYLNAGIQGSRMTLRTFRNRPAATTLKVATSLFTPVAVATMWNTATEERKKAYMDIPDWERNNYLIVLPPHPEVDKEGNYVGAIKVPLPQGFNSLAVPVRTSIEHMAGVDQTSVQDALFDTLTGVTTVNFGDQGELVSRITPTAILPVIENYTNTKLFSGTKLIPRNLENLPPAQQTKAGISGAVEKIGEATNMSPILIQNFIQDYTGGVGLEVLNAVDRGLVMAGYLKPEDVGGKGLIEDIKFRFARARGGRLDSEEFDKADALKEKAAMREKNEDAAAEQIYKELQKIPEDQWKPKLSELKQTGVLTEPIYEEIVALDKATKQNLSRSEKFVKSLPVPERAEYILEELGKMPREQHRSYLSELKRKGIFTINIYNKMVESGYELP